MTFLKKLLFVTWVVYIFSWSVFAQSSVKNSIQAIEQRSGVSDTDLYTNIHSYDILKTLEGWCEARPVAKWKAFLQAWWAIMDNKYSTLDSAAILEDTWSLYGLLKSINENKLPAYNWNDYCKLKYAIVWLQQYMRDKHLEVMEKTWVISDFDGINFNNIQGYAVKLQALKNHNKKYGSYKAKIGTPLKIQYTNSWFKNSLTQDQQAILEQSDILMQNMVAYSLYELKRKWVIKQEDIDRVVNKLVFEYVQECGLFNWKYEIKETLDWRGNHIKYETNALELKVNFCPSYFVIREMPTLFNKIITHEMGHHVYYYQDNNAQAFESICWNSETVQNNQCSSADFVSDYSKIASLEDYAEQFMHWFLWIWNNNTAILKKKRNHFENL